MAEETGGSAHLHNTSMVGCSFGRERKPTRLQANHDGKFSGFDDDIVFYQYSVSIKSDDRIVEGKRIAQKVILKMLQTYGSELDGKDCAYDGEKYLFTIGPLPRENFEFTVVIEETSSRYHLPMEFTVGLSYNAKIPLRSVALALQGSGLNWGQHSLRTIENILRQQKAKRDCLLTRQPIFNAENRNLVDLTTLDPLTTVATPRPVVNFLLKKQNVREIRDIDWEKAKHMLKNLRVRATHGKKEFKIIGLSDKPCCQQIFPKNVPGGSGDLTSEVTVAEYFKSKQVHLKNTNLHCLDVGKPKYPNYLPMELANLIPFQRYTNAPPYQQGDALVKKPQQKPQYRMRIVSNVDGAQSITQNMVQPSNACVDEPEAFQATVCQRRDDEGTHEHKAEESEGVSSSLQTVILNSSLLHINWHKDRVVSEVDSTAFATTSSSTPHRQVSKANKRNTKESLLRQSLRPRGHGKSLPLDMLMTIGRKLVGSSLKDLVSMKSACKSWASSLETSGPWLVASCPSSFKIFFMKIVSHEGGYAAVEEVDLLSPPPPGSFHCWGAANGLLALHNKKTDRTYLHCPLCGFESDLTKVPANMDPKGLYFRNASAMLVIMELEANNLLRLLHLQEFCDEEMEGDPDEEDISLSWAPYPGAKGYSRMESVNFTEDVSFAAVTSDSFVILDQLVRQIGEDMIEIEVYAEDEDFTLWDQNGCHIFVCKEEIYICYLLRSKYTSTVRARVFHLQLHDDEDYDIIPTDNIGQYSVFLGSNQSVVLPSIESSVGRQANTVYVEDDDGLKRFQILSINLQTQDTLIMPFPPDIISSLTDSTRAAWVSPPCGNCQTQGGGGQMSQLGSKAAK